MSLSIHVGNDWSTTTVDGLNLRDEFLALVTRLWVESRESGPTESAASATYADEASGESLAIQGTIDGDGVSTITQAVYSRSGRSLTVSGSIVLDGATGAWSGSVASMRLEDPDRLDVTFVGSGTISGSGTGVAISGAVQTLNVAFLSDDEGITINGPVGTLGNVGGGAVTIDTNGSVGSGTVAVVSAGGSTGNISLQGTNGSDTLTGGTGSDTLTGGAGNDVYVVSTGGHVVLESGGQGIDTLMLSPGARLTVALGSRAPNVENIILTGTNVSNAVGTDEDNYLTGNSAANSLVGGAGSDTLDGAAGHDSLAGGVGNDLYIVDLLRLASAPLLEATISEALNQGTDTLRVRVAQSLTLAAPFTLALGANLENLDLSETGTLALHATGNGLANLITGNAGANSLIGGLGADTLVGGAGNDTYLVDQVAELDFITEEPEGGTDTLRIGYANASATVPQTISLGGSLEHLENVMLVGAGLFNVTGNAAVNVLAGNASANRLDGAAGADYMAGAGGNDTYVVDDAGDQISDTAGIDTVESTVSYSIASAIENITLLGESAINATGNALANLLTGNAGANTLTGLGGNDTYVVQNTDDAAVEAPNQGTDLVRSSASFTLGDHVENLTLTAGDIDGTGNALVNTITGSTGSNVLDGRGGRDILLGGAGNDTYIVDLIRSGAAALLEDTITESPNQGTDTLRLRVAEGLTLTAPFTVLLGAQIENLDLGQTGTLALHGTGNALNNSLTGNAGANTLDGGLGNDTYVDSAGDDTYVIAHAGDSVEEGSGNGADTVRVVLSGNTYLDLTSKDFLENVIYTGTGAQSLKGNASANSLTAGAGADSLAGGDGADTLVGGAGADTMRGGDGDDTYFLDHASDKALEDGSGIDTIVTTANVTLDGASTIENVTLAGSAISATGNPGNNKLVGNASANTLNGGGGEDTLEGGAGADVYIVDGGDVVTDIAGVAGGIDLVRSAVTFTLGEHLENLTLTSGDIDGTGNALVNTITGSAGPNVLDGKGGRDVLIGGAGNDTYVVDLIRSGAAALLEDTVTEALDQGSDTLRLRVAEGLTLTVPFTVLLGANVENLDLSETGILALHGTGNALDNTLTGNAAANTLDGGTGNDTYIDSAGDDTYLIAQAGDTVEEGAGSGADTVRVALTGSTYLDLSSKTYLENVVYTGAGAQVIRGNTSANSLTGAAGADSLEGGDGADTLVGGTGADTMRGGDGDDTYFLDHASDKALEEGTGIDTVVTTANITLEPASTIENVTLAGAATSATGNAGNNKLVGNASANTLNGGGGEDTLEGGAGADVYIVDSGDVVTEIAGATGGIDVVRSSVTYSLGEYVENLVLTAGNIDGTGNALVNAITGSMGNNVLDGKGGRDVLIGGQGNDTYIVDLIRSGSTVLVEDTITEAANAGIDTLQIRADGGLTLPTATFTYTLVANVEDLDFSQTGALAINATGTAAANAIVGNAGNNLIIGLGGSDSLSGGEGNDTFVWDTADAGVDGGGGNDTLRVDGANVRVELGGSVDIVGMEVVDLTGSGNNTLVVTDYGLHRAGGTLRVDGNTNDVVRLGSDWVRGANQAVGANTYATFSYGDERILIDTDISLDMANGVPLGDSVALTGDPFLDGLIQGGAWDLPDSRILTYSLNINNDGPPAAWNGTLSEAVDRAFREWASVADIKFQRIESGTYYYQSGADISVILTKGGLDGAAGAGVFPDPLVADQILAGGGENRFTYPRPEGDIFLDVAILNSPDYFNAGGPGYLVLLHEIGHALGLKHPADDGGNARPTFEELGIGEYEHPDYTIMEGEVPDARPNSPMPLDIQAIQHIYGANTSFNAGDDTYIPSAGYRTIWDGGGLDTLSAQFTATPQILDLRGGSLVGEVGRTFTGIAYGADIENAIGGAAGDVITGNELANSLRGGGGSDTITGNEGSDTLDGGLGLEVLQGGSGDDVYVLADRGSELSFVVEQAGVTRVFDFGSLWNAAASDYFADADSLVDTIRIEAEQLVLHGATQTVRLELSTSGLNVPILAGTYEVLEGGQLSGASSLALVINSSSSTPAPGTVLTVDEIVVDYSGSMPTLLAMAGEFTWISNGALTTGTFAIDHRVDSPRDAVSESADGGRDRVETPYSYVLGANLEDLTLTGANGVSGSGNGLSNTIVGNSASNSLYGGLGNDTLSSDGGSDTFTGGAGLDVFVIESSKRFVAQIIDFAPGMDLIGLGPVFAPLFSEDQLRPGILGEGDEATSPEQRLLYDASSGHLYFDADGSGALSATHIASVGAGTVLGTSDFTLLANVPGVDTVFSAVNHSLAPSLENLTLTGAADVAATGNSMDNVLIGNDGANRLDGGGGADTLDGGAGNDTYVIDSLDDIVRDTAGTDTVQTVFSYSLGTDIETLELIGSANSEGHGNAGNNVLIGNSGLNTLFGNGGDDQYFLQNSEDEVVELPDSGVDTVFFRKLTGGGSYSLAANLENLTLQGSAFGGTGNSLDNVIVGQEFINLLKGLDGNDSLDGGGTGGDTLEGGSGNDTLAGASARLIGGEGDDVYYSVLEESRVFSIDIWGTPGSTLFDGEIHLDAEMATGANQLRDPFFVGPFSLDSDPARAEIRISAVGHSGVDIRLGPYEAGLRFVEGQTYSTATSGVFPVANVTHFFMTATGFDANGGRSTGSFVFDSLELGGTASGSWYMNSAEMHFEYLKEGDVGPVTGILIVEPGRTVRPANSISEGVDGGIDTLVARADAPLSAPLKIEGTNVENVTLVGSGTAGVLGSSAGNVLRGNGAANVLDGQAGNDTLVGGGGADTLTGGVGDDVFVIEAAGRHPVKIVDFTSGEDVIGLGSSFAGLFVDGTLATGVLGQQFGYSSITGELYYDADGAGAGTAMKVATLATGLTLTADDFTHFP